MALAKYRCLECKSEVELDDNTKSRNCPKCLSRFLELVVGKLKHRQPWTNKTFRVSK